MSEQSEMKINGFTVEEIDEMIIDAMVFKSFGGRSKVVFRKKQE